MTYQFTDAEIEIIDDKVAAAEQSGTGWAEAYKYVATLLRDKVLNDGTNPKDDLQTRKSWLFITGAAMVNEQRGPFAAFIKGYAYRQAELRGISLSDSLMQEASDKVAREFFKQLTDTRRVPPIDDILQNDLQQVSHTLFSQSDGSVYVNNTAWPGTIVASLFGTTYDYSEYLLGRDDAMNTVDDVLTA